MGMQLGSRGGGRSGRRKVYRAMSEINVTPFVDVMLVLLIVFMVTAPLLTVGVPLDLPQTNAPPLEAEKDPLTVSVQTDGTIYLQETAIDLAGLVPRLVAITGANPEARILVRGDRGNNYGRMVEVLSAISTAGFKKIGLAAELPGSTPSAASGGTRAAAARGASGHR
jgi:biopolymer transport protein TolR